MKFYLALTVLLVTATFLSAEKSQKNLKRKKRSVIKIPKLPDSMQQVQTQTQTQTQEVTCVPECSENGACTDVNTCTCADGWTGVTCEEYNCADACQNGLCSGPNTCTCNENWEGATCSEAVCSPACLNSGKCTSPNNCECTEHWKGDQCETPICGTGCQNDGVCTAPNVCECNDGYKGDHCEIPLPKDCVFPFEYDGKIFEECTKGDNDEYWCSTTTIYQGDHRICHGLPEIESTIDLPQPEISGAGLPGIEGSTAGLPGIEGSGAGLPDIEGSTAGFPDTIASGEGSGNEGEGVAHLQGNTCGVWKGEHYHTFDGVLYSSTGKCHYQVVADCHAHSFVISVYYTSEGKPVLRISNADLEIELSQGAATYNGEKVQIPSLTNGVHIETIPHTDYIVLYGQLFGLSISWDGDSSFFIHVKDEDKWFGKLCGLCGNYNGNQYDDMVPKGLHDATENIQKLMDSWGINDQAEACTTPEINHYCSGLTTQQVMDAANVCEQLKQEDAFAACAGYVAEATFNELCLMSMCQCTSDYTDCICDSLTQYSRLCVARGAFIDNWRTNDYCKKECSGGMVRQECGSACPKTCRNRRQQMLCHASCVDGCFCPVGTVLDGDICVPENECSCVHNEVTFKNGEVRNEECKECTCVDGMWACELLPCGAECAVTGDPHYRTFDGVAYNFDGQCQYVLATDGCAGADYTFLITSENIECGESGYCTKSVLLVTKGVLGKHKYKLSQSEVVAIDDVTVSLPYRHGDVSVEKMSNLVVRLRSVLGFDLEWDGAMRVYIKLSPAWKNKVCGMCGNFNDMSTDEYTTSQGTVVTSVTTFGNSWKLSQECPDALPVLPDACKVSKELEEYSETMCSVIKGDVFASCHSLVDWNLYYHNCRSDVCRCGTVEACACDAIADYARECSKKGAIVHWRGDTFCSVSCGENLVYHECGSLCSTTCRSLGDFSMECDQCSEGCFCPKETYLTEDGTCVAIEKCECSYLGQTYATGEKLELSTLSCVCENGKMACQNVTENYSCAGSFEYFDCRTAPAGSRGLACKSTCGNPFNKLCDAEVEQCISGCGCPVGKILDEHTDVCVPQEDCTCSHNDKVYMPGDKRMDYCNTCTCSNGVWECTEEACSAECSAIGDPHYTTFDGLTYDYQGACSYTFVQDVCNGKTSGTFRVVVENVPCGNSAVTCTKAVTVYLYQYAIHFTKGEGEPIVTHKNSTNAGLASTPSAFDYHVRQGTIYYILETNIGISVLWNHDNAVKVQLSPQYNGAVCGLCGNFDYNQNNDFQTSDGDIVADPNVFGNSWKLIETCPDAGGEAHPCLEYPHRAPWSEKKCAIITSEVFSKCHAAVDPTTYYENCLYDTCGCDFGGDCECFCTAVATYAQACSQAGVCVTWRDTETCPVMCEAFDPGYGTSDDYVCDWKYETCGNPCPRTCWNLKPETCPWDQLEGCYVKCKDDEVWDDEEKVCKHESECPPPPPPPPSTTTTPVITTTPTTTIETPTPSILFCHCEDANGEIHLPGETWPLRDDPTLCMTMTCVEEQPGICRVEATDTRQTCESQTRPHCVNNFPAVAVDDGCSCHWECKCYCFGQGDPHFFTFDGFYYPFQGNCTFVLARSSEVHASSHMAISSSSRDFEIYMQNVQCVEAPTTTCTRKLVVKFNNTDVGIIDDYTFTVNGGPPADARENLPATINGISIQMRGTTLFYVTIEALGLVLTYTGEDYSWGLHLPYGYAEDNTEGLCGICNNNQEDELTMRGGEISTDIEEFGYSWLVHKERFGCYEPPIDCPDPPAPECDIILSPIFEACHPLVDPDKFHKICQFDTKCGPYSFCEAIYGYARICQEQGACIDWRNVDLCPLECTDNLVYEACRPNCEDTCVEYNQGVSCEIEQVVEGCFCPPDTILSQGECVPTSNCTNCVGPDGEIYKYGDSWVKEGESCTICSCMEKQEIKCTPKSCPAGWSPEVPVCHPCHVLQMKAESDPCCPEYHCICDYENSKGSDDCSIVTVPHCSEDGHVSSIVNPHQCIPQYDCVCDTASKSCPKAPVCSDIEYLHTEHGDCCSKHECKCKTCPHDNVFCDVCENKVVTIDACNCPHTTCEIMGVCHYNGTNYKPGEEYKASPCQTCTCHESETNSRGCFHADCYLMSCSSYCPPCHGLVTMPGECCGTCVQNACEVTAPDGEMKCVDIGMGWEDMDKCTESLCVADKDGVPTIIDKEYECPNLIVPTCGPCYQSHVYTENCCSVAECVKSDVCCNLDGSAVKQPGENWYPDSCTTCTCTSNMNHTSGFHIVNCQAKACQEFDESACKGMIVPTEDGCCTKCDHMCIDSNNNFYPLGDNWFPDSCTICSCVAGYEISCRPRACNSTTGGEIPECPACHVPVRIADSDPCCPEYECTCNYELGKGDSENCPAIAYPSCKAGFAPVLTNPNDCIPSYVCTCDPNKSPCPVAPTCSPLYHAIVDDSNCCPTTRCVCNKCAPTKSCSLCEDTSTVIDECGCAHVTCVPRQVCVHNHTLYDINQNWNPDVCTHCTCLGDSFNTESNCYDYACYAESCSPECPPCHTYTHVPGQCCGTCVQSACVVDEENGVCANVGDHWDDVDSCTAYVCSVIDDKMEIVDSDYQCSPPQMPLCKSCYKLEEYTEDCCKKYRCVPNQVCCYDELPMQPESSWHPDECTVCQCKSNVDEHSGFHEVQCLRKPCPPVDVDVCLSKGGSIVATEDGCCTKCQIDACFECSRHISSNLDFVTVGPCTSVQQHPVAYCDGFCRSGSLWSAVGFRDQCGCCKPASHESRVIQMKCEDGSHFDYEWNLVTRCGCTSSCDCEAPPNPPNTTPVPTGPEPTTTEETGSGSGEEPTTPPTKEVPTTTPTVPTTTTEEPGSGSGEEPTTPPTKEVPTTTEETEESGSGEEPTTPPTKEVPTKTPVTTQPTTTEENEESGSGEEPTTPPTKEIPTTTPTTPSTTTEEIEESGSGSGEEPTTPPTKEIPTTTPTTIAPTTTEETEESGSGEEPTTPPTKEIPTTTTQTTIPTTTEELEESGSGSGEEPTTPPTKEIPTTTPTTPAPTTTEELEESGSGSGIEPTTPPTKEVPTTTPTTIAPTTTTAPTTTAVPTTTEEQEESGSGSGEEPTTPPTKEVPTTTPTTIAPTTTTAPTTTAVPTTTEEQEESGSGSGEEPTTPPTKELPTTTPTTTVPTTTTTVPTTTTTVPTTTEEMEESGSGEESTTPPTKEVPTTTPTTTSPPTTTEATEPPTTQPPTTTTLKTTPKTTPQTTTTTTKPTTTEATTTTQKITTTTEKETTTTKATTTKPSAEPVCYWTEWMNSDFPKLPYRNDNETYHHLREDGNNVCENPTQIECRPSGGSVGDFTANQEWQAVTCDLSIGLICLGDEQPIHPVCDDYEIRVHCCDATVSTTKTPATTQHSSTSGQSSSGGGQWQHQSQSQGSGGQSQSQGQIQINTGSSGQSQGQSQSQSQEVSDITSHAQSVIDNLEDSSNADNTPAHMPLKPDTAGSSSQSKIQSQHSTSQHQVQVQHSGSSSSSHHSSSSDSAEVISSLTDQDILDLLSEMDSNGDFEPAHSDNDADLQALIKDHINTGDIESDLESELSDRLSSKNSVDDDLTDQIKDLLH